MMRIRKIRVGTAYPVALLALAASVFFLSPAIFNPYVVNDDATQCIFWMRQFREPALFRDDLLSEYAQHWLPWGFIFIYFAGSLLVDPLLISKLAPLVLLPLSAVFLYGLLKTISGSRYTGFLGTVIFLFTGSFFQSMVGGYPRAFGFPLLFIFLYYSIRRRYCAVAVVLVAQSLIYPIVFLLSVLASPAVLILRKDESALIERAPVRMMTIILGILVGLAVLLGKYAALDNPRMGSIITREEAASQPETTEGGRSQIMPVSPLLKQIMYNFKEGVLGDRAIEYLRGRSFLTVFFRKYDRMVAPRRPGWTVTPAIALAMFIILVAMGLLSGVRFPAEIYFLLAAGIVMYWLSSQVLFKLYRPERYMEYSFRTSGLIIFSVIVGRLIEGIRGRKLKSFCRAVPISLICLFFPAHRGLSLTDYSRHQELYKYLHGLPPGALVAAHPSLADGIPLFSQKRVFISFELSNPWYRRYWETIRERTYDFFNAYYSESLETVGEFCRQNAIDYLVVDDRHFRKEYLAGGRAYFEPFGSYIARLSETRRNFILPRIGERSKLFSRNGISVIAGETFGECSDSNRGSEEGPPDA